MATRTISVAGGNWNAVGTWLEGAVPTAADDVVATALSGNVTIPAAVTALARSVDFTTYVGTLTFAATTSVLTVGDASGGALKFVAGMKVTLTGVGTINLVSTSSNGGVGWGITTEGKTMPNVTFNGAGGKWVLQDALTISAGNLGFTAGTLDTSGFSVLARIFSASGGQTRTLTLGSSTVTLYGTSGNGSVPWFLGSGVTVTANTAVVYLSGTSVSFTSPAGFDHNGMSVVHNGGGVLTVTAAMTVADFTQTGTATKTVGLSLGGNLTATGTFTATGNSAVNRILVQSSVVGTTRTITAAVVSATNVDWSDIAAEGAAAPFTGTSMGDALGNSGITFDASVTQTFSGTGNWSDATKWTSRVPLPQDDVVVGTGATGTVTIDMPRIGRSVDFSTCIRTVSWGVVHALYGSLTLGAGITMANNNGTTFSGRGSHTITSAGKTFLQSLAVSAPGGTYTLLDALTTSGAFFPVAGTFDTNGMAFTLASLASTGALTRHIAFGLSLVTITSTAANPWLISGSGFTLNAGTSVIAYATPAATSRTFNGAGLTYGTLRYTVADSPGGLVVTGANTFAALDIGPGRTLTLPSATTTTVGTDLDLDGDDFGYLYSPGVAGSHASTPTLAAPASPDLDVIFGGALIDWGRAARDTFGGNLGADGWAFTTNGASFRLDVDLAGGTVGTNMAIPASFVDGVERYVRVTRVSATGVIAFYEGTTPIGPWTLIGSAANTSGPITTSANPLYVGTYNGSSLPLLGRVARFIVKDGIDGTVVADYDPASHVVTSDTYTDSTGKVWTLSGLARQGLGRVTLNASTPASKAILSVPAAATRPVEFAEVVDNDADGTAIPLVAYDSTLANTTDWLAVDRKSGSDTANLTATEAVTPISAVIASTDLASLSVDDVAAILANVATSDTADLTITDAYAILAELAGLDAADLTLAEAGNLAAMFTAADALELAATEARTLAATLASADAIDLELLGAASAEQLLSRACMAVAVDLVTRMTATVTTC